MRLRTSVVVAVVLALAAIVAAQSDRGRLTGTIADQSGASLPGVTVTLSGPEQRTTVTNERGTFEFQNLLPGMYELSARLSGFVDVMRKVTVGRGATPPLTIQMTVAALTETVTVSAHGVSGGTPAGEAVPQAAPVAALEPPAAARIAGLMRVSSDRFNTESYAHIEENGLRRVVSDPLSTFSIDVDTASYANVRRFLSTGALPPPGAVRVEELINYFRFDYPAPTSDVPFSVTTELAECPWNPQHRLALVGIPGARTGRSAVDTTQPGVSH